MNTSPIWCSLSQIRFTEYKKPANIFLIISSRNNASSRLSETEGENELYPVYTNISGLVRKNGSRRCLF